MTKRTAFETATLLKEIFVQKFGGKPSGRYQIYRGHLLKLAGHRIFPPSFLEQLTIEGLDLGIAIVDIGTSFAVIELSVLEGFRNVPHAVIEKNKI
jgi:hypothetical protein